MRGVVVGRNFCHVKNGAASPNPPHPNSSSQSQAHDLRSFLRTGRSWSLWGFACGGCGPLSCRRVCSLNLGACPQWGGFSLKTGAFSERGTLSRSSQRLSSCTALKTSCSNNWFTTNLSPVVTTRCIGSPLKAPMGSGSTSSSASPMRRGVAPKGKRITPAPKQCWEW